MTTRGGPGHESISSAVNDIRRCPRGQSSGQAVVGTEEEETMGRLIEFIHIQPSAQRRSADREVISALRADQPLALNAAIEAARAGDEGRALL